MLLADFLQFVLQLLLAGMLLRYAEIKLAGSSFGNALSFIY